MASATKPTSASLTLEDIIADLLSGSTGRLRKSAETMLRDMSRIDQALYEAVASTPSPTVDALFRRLSNAANRSALWLCLAAALTAFRSRRGNRAAIDGLASIAVASVVVNVGLKRIYSRRRPDREAAGVTGRRHVTMPESSSFPSGHSASGFAFATAVGRDLPWLAFPLTIVAAAVAYSRIHTGVHYPGDAVAGALVGGATGLAVGTALDRSWRRRR